MEQRKLTSNKHILLWLIHVARFVVYSGFALAMFVDLVTWRPSPPVPGGPIVMQLRPFLPTLLMILTAFFRGVLTKRIWSFHRSTIRFGAVVDASELVIAAWLMTTMISHVIYFRMIVPVILFFSVLTLSITSLLLSILVYYNFKE
ncbi:MAG: hypothetical protein ACXAAO_02450 [Candidatus Thorarchaeota archaeon]